MNINRNNYEVYMIDYFDGKLDPVQTAELMYFLSQNPDLEHEFNAYENVNLPADILKFEDKDGLRKSFGDFPAVTDNNFEEFCIAEIEGDLDEKSQARLYQYLDKNPHKKRELELYQKTKLRPDESVVFPGLNQLKKHRLNPYHVNRILYYTGVAAAVLLIVFLTFVFRRTPDSDLITSTVPVLKDAKKTVEDMTSQTEKENTSSIQKEAFRDSDVQSVQENKMISVVNDVPKSAPEEDIEASGQILKPIEIRKIDNVYHPSNIAQLSKNHPIKSHTNPPVQTDKSLAEFIKEKFMATEITKSAENLSVWTFAQASIKGINYLTESDVRMSRKLNMNGKMSEFSIDSESFSFSTPLKK